MKLHLRARVSSDSPDSIGRFLLDNLAVASLSRDGDDLIVPAVIDAQTAREANRRFLSRLKRADRKARLRAEWTHAGLTERFLNYAPEGTDPALP